jgi:hypothetical protein
MVLVRLLTGVTRAIVDGEDLRRDADWGTLRLSGSLRRLIEGSCTLWIGWAHAGIFISTCLALEAEASEDEDATDGFLLPG